MVKTRKITKKDYVNVETFIKNTLEERKASKFRKRHEAIWKEVDRQVAMEPMARDKRDRNSADDWRSALEMGELSRASEILSAEVRRLTFPQNRSWFEAHSNIEFDVDPENGQPMRDGKIQRRTDGQVRALMSQQHLDFGFKARVDLSVKEALHHGSYVVEVDYEHSMMVHDGDGVQTFTAPIWTPHSMWNCYPDPSTAVIGTNMFYSGSMLICHTVKPHIFKSFKGEGWMTNRFKEVERKGSKQEDIELKKYYGDIVIKRGDGDIYLPNYKAITANDVLVYLKENETPFIPIIYNGYERLDVRDPYYVSPLIKMSPTHKMYSILSNRFLDNIDLNIEPPVVYDGSDPDLVMNGGPQIYPGSKVPSKHGANFKEVKIGDPGVALSGLQFLKTQLDAGTAVDNIRAGMTGSTEQTATEVVKASQSAEIRTVDFVDKHELHGLRPFLYMQHLLNKKRLSNYPIYNSELDAPDFEVLSKEDIPSQVHFEIVGSKGLLGEEQRQAKTSQATAFWMQVAPDKLNIEQLMLESYRDAGNKNPERFLVLEEKEQAMMEEFQAQMEQMVAQFQQEMAAMQEELTQYQFQDEEHSLEIESEKLKQDMLKDQISKKELQIETLNQLLRQKREVMQ